MALLAILRFWWSDHVYQEDAWGSQILGRMARAPRFNAWMADTTSGYSSGLVNFQAMTEADLGLYPARMAASPITMFPCISTLFTVNYSSIKFNDLQIGVAKR